MGNCAPPKYSRKYSETRGWCKAVTYSPNKELTAFTGGSPSGLERHSLRILATRGEYFIWVPHLPQAVWSCKGNLGKAGLAAFSEEVRAALQGDACYNENTMAPNHPAKERRRVTPGTTEVKTWLAAELGLVHTSHCYNAISEVKGDHVNTRADEQSSPRNYAVRMAGSQECIS